MIRQNRRLKKNIGLNILLCLIVLSSLQGIITFNGTIFENEKLDNIITNPKDTLLNADVNDAITGAGVNQTARIIMKNSSQVDKNHEYFNISSPEEDTYLNYGNFTFEFQNNYTTDYILEDDNALELPIENLVEFNMSYSTSNITINPLNNNTDAGVNNDNYNDVFDFSNATYWVLNSSNKRIKFNITANFTNTYANNPNQQEFNRTKILGFLLDMTFNLTNTASLTIQLYNQSNSKWENISYVEDLSSSSTNNINDRFINKHLNYINTLNSCRIQLDFNSTNPFNLTLYGFDFHSIYALELPVKNEDYVALKFPLKGCNSSVNGFYAWVRALDLTEAENSLLNISLMRSTPVGDPDYSQLIDNKTVYRYKDDNIHYFSFNKTKTMGLNNSEYFVVIKSNNSNAVYSIVVINSVEYGNDGEIEHVLKTTSDDGQNWDFAGLNVGSTASTNLDASSFKLNVTRGYIPSDFNNTLRIQNESSIESDIIPFATAPDIEWGIGKWVDNFTYPIESDFGKFRVNLTWDTALINDFEFNVSFSVEAYKNENTTTIYSVNYDGTPEWQFNYLFNLSDFKYMNWDFSELWYLYPTYFNATHLYDPNNVNRFDSIASETNYFADPSLDIVIVNSSITGNVNGTYSLRLISQNLLDKDSFLHSYINFNDNLWETEGFMLGDNISIGIDIQNSVLKAPDSGNASVTMFKPDGTKYDELKSTSGEKTKDKSYLQYDFNNITIAKLDEGFPLATSDDNYILGYFWTNGSAIGCRKKEIFINNFNLSVSNLEYIEEIDYNILKGSVSKIQDQYSLLVATVRDITGQSIPDFYPVNNQSVEGILTYDYNNEEVEVKVKSFKQNETIINPGEDLNFEVVLQNLNNAIDLNVKVSIKLVSLANEEWIIAEGISSPTTLKLYGDTENNDTKTFDLSLSIPSKTSNNIWYGTNSPIRKAGAKTIVSLYIDNNYADSYSFNDYSLIVNDTEDKFEGYVSTLKFSKNISSNALSQTFNRSECLYLPEANYFVINLFDQNFMSTYDKILYNFALKRNTQFVEVLNAPDNPINGSVFNISAYLQSEFEEAIGNVLTSCQLYQNNTWKEIALNYTDSKGFVTYIIDAKNFSTMKNPTFRLVYSGNAYFTGTSTNYTLEFTQLLNDVSIQLLGEQYYIYRNKKSIIDLRIRNNGNSTFNISNIEANFDLGIENSIVSVYTEQLREFEPGESLDVKIEVSPANIAKSEINLTVLVTAENEISSETFRFSNQFQLSVIDAPITEFILEILTVFAIVAIISVWVVGLLGARYLKRKVETPVEEVKEAPRKKGKYIRVEELEEVEPESGEIEEKVEKQPKKPEKVRSRFKRKKKKAKKPSKKEKATDLDALLEEEGLSD